jgi:N-methylhydantoinase A
VCYSLGGTEPTLSDANLLLGYLNASALLGAQLPLDKGLAERVFRERVSGPLGLDLLESAYGVHQIAVANMVRAVRAISSERGRDPRRFTFVAYGGNGPLHAVSAATELGVRSILVPPAPGVFSAVGLLAAEPAQHAARSFLRLTSELSPETLESAYCELEQRVTGALLEEGHTQANIHVVRTIDLHYVGQSFELSLPMDSPITAGLLDKIDERFAAEHERSYGHRADHDPVEVVHVRVEGRVRSYKPATFTPDGVTSEAASQPTRPAYFGPRHGLLQTRVVHRGQLSSQDVEGPLIVEEYDATTVVSPGWFIRRDAADNLVIHA